MVSLPTNEVEMENDRGFGEEEMVSQPECGEVAMDLFMRVDVGNKGFVTKEDLRKFTIQVMSGMKSDYEFNEEEFDHGFKMLDSDGDGQLNQRDFATMVESSFKAIGTLK